MADEATTERGRVRPIPAVPAYFMLARMWIRASLAYRASFVMMTFTQFFITFIDFVAILVMFSNIDSLGGFDIAEIGLLYGISSFALGSSDMIVGNVERVGRHVRSGAFDVMMIRPVPTIVQVCTDDYALRRLGRVSQAVIVLVWSLARLDVSWTAGRVAMFVVALISGPVIFSSIYILGGALQFWSGDSAEVSNAFTYGGNYLTQYPLTIYPGAIVKAITFIVPLAFINWYPVLYVLGRPVPGDLPDWLRFLSPVAAIIVAAIATVVWRMGTDRYQSTGS